MRKLFVLVLALNLIPALVHAQHIQGNRHQCLTDYYYEKAVAENPSIRQEENNFNELVKNMPVTKSKTNGTVQIIPVVFHVMYAGGRENISKEQIDDQIRILNEDFRKMAGTPGGSSTNPLAADCEIEFRLAEKDPNGTCTDGINRVFSTLTNDADDAIKNVIVWNTQRYMNIWVVANIKDTDGDPNTTTLGYAQFPWMGSTSKRGVVIRADYVGTIGTSSKSKGGRVLTHEIGHCLGLFHTFQGGCFGGDQVGDTPPVADQNFGNCSPAKNTCNNDSPDQNDMLENYMDYTDGDCQNLFTAGQKARMLSSINSYYSTLVSASNLITTGVEGYVPPASTNVTPVKQDFESVQANNQTLSNNWVIENLGGDGLGWRTTDSASYDGSRCIYIPNFFNTTGFARSTWEFLSPSFNLAFNNTAYLNFNLSYAQKTLATNDSLRIYISTDCGITWNNIYRNGGVTMSTIGSSMNTVFYPSSTSQWRGVTIDLAAYKTSSNVRLRFEFYNLRGNNLFIDNILIGSQPVNTPYIAPIFSEVQVYPNPVLHDATLQFSLRESSEVEMELYDLMGRKLNGVNQPQYMSAGTHEVKLSSIGAQDLAGGIYLLKLKAAGQSSTQKFVVSK